MVCERNQSLRKLAISAMRCTLCMEESLALAGHTNDDDDNDNNDVVR